MNRPMLTIAIPTYNRPEQLRHTLSVIGPQVARDERACLLILDNHSQVPAAEVLEGLELSLPSQRIQVVRNQVNIGANANIMRCFEFCETPWLWVLGDDDLPTEDALSTILEDTTGNHCYGFYTVPSINNPHFQVGEPQAVSGQGFADLIARFGNDIELLAFLSAAVFNMEMVRPFLIDGYLSANTGTPHLLMVLKALAQGHQWMISRRTIAEYNPPVEGAGWGFMTIAFAVPCLLGLAASGEEVRLVRQRMVLGWRISPKKILYSLISKYLKNPGSSREIRFLFATIKQLYAPPWKMDPMLRLRWHITSVWAFFPATFALWYRKKKSGKARILLVNDERR